MWTSNMTEADWSGLFTNYGGGARDVRACSMRGRGYGVCILGLSLWAMVTSERLEWPQSGVKTQPTSLHGSPI